MIDGMHMSIRWVPRSMMARLQRDCLPKGTSVGTREGQILLFHTIPNSLH